MTPTFSVVIPTWNRASVVGRAIETVLAQTFSDFELIVVDDGSTDDTAQVLAEIDDRRLRQIVQQNAGESAARNTGGMAATGTYLTFLDSDDEARPQWLESLFTSLERHHADIVICGQEAVDSQGRIYGRWVPEPGSSFDRLAVRFEAGQVAMKRELFNAVGGYETSISYGQHTELAIRLLCSPGCASRLALVPEPHVLVHRPSTRTHGRAQVESAAFVLDRHPGLHREAPHLWASYNAIVGVDLARRGDLAAARRHFLSALRSEPTQWRHAARLFAALALPLARKAWPDAERGQSPD